MTSVSGRRGEKKRRRGVKTSAKGVEARPGEMSQSALAQALGLTTRQVRNLEEQGMPHRTDGTRKWYPVPEALQWYYEQRLGGREGMTPLQQAELRKKLADAEAAEITVAERRAQLISRRDMVVMIREPLDRVNAQLLRAPTRYAPACVGLTTIEEALQVWQQAIDEIREELRTLGDVAPERHGDEDAGAGAG